MLTTFLPSLVAFGVALLAAAAVRLAGGPERGARLAGLAVGVGALAGLAAVAGFAWSGVGPVSRIGHVLIGAVLAGAALDELRPPPAGRWAVLGVFALGCGWASGVGALVPRAAPEPVQLGLAAVLALIWFGLMARFAAPGGHAAGRLVVLVAAATGLALLALVAGDRPLAQIGAVLAAALLGFALVAALADVALGLGAVVPAAAGLAALAWALAQRHPEAGIGIAVLALVLFAERTARRVPMPGGRISAYLYLAVLAGCCAIPVVIAALLVSAAATA